LALNSVGRGPWSTLTAEWAKAARRGDAKEETKLAQEGYRLRAAGIEPVSVWEDGQHRFQLTCTEGLQYELRITRTSWTPADVQSTIYYIEGGRVSRTGTKVDLHGEAAYTATSLGALTPNVGIDARQPVVAQGVRFVSVRKGPWRSMLIVRSHGLIGLRFGVSMLHFAGSLPKD
jgi:hypothetical protein